MSASAQNEAQTTSKVGGEVVFDDGAPCFDDEQSGEAQNWGWANWSNEGDFASKRPAELGVDTVGSHNDQLATFRGTEVADETIA